LEINGQSIINTITNSKKSPEEYQELTTEGYKSLMDDEENVSSLLRKYLTPELLEEYMLVTTPAPVDAYLYDCAVSGFEHHEAPVGIYAADADGVLASSSQIV